MNSPVKLAAASRRTAPRTVRRRQLIVAAMDSIAKRGFADTTLRHVTENANLSHGVVNYHFDSKEALYDATLGFMAQEHYDLWTKALADAGDEPARQLTAIIEADFDRKACTQKKLAVWFAFWGQAKYRPNYLKIHNKFDNERSAELKRICATLIHEGGYTGQTAAQSAHAIEAMLDGLWLSLLLYPMDETREGGLQIALTTVARLFPSHFAADGVVATPPRQ